MDENDALLMTLEGTVKRLFHGMQGQILLMNPV